MRRFRVIRIETSGMKGLDKSVSIDFENLTMSKSVFNKGAIKAIYGSNGSGKTSLITSVDVYKKICLDSSLLYSYSATLKKLINKLTSKFSFKVFFVSENKKTYYHSITIDASSEKPYITEETIGIVTGRTINEETRTVVEIRNGKIAHYENTLARKHGQFDVVIKDAINKLSEYRSIITLMTDRVFFSDVSAVNGNKLQNSVFSAMMYTFFFVNSVFTYLANSDRHEETTWESFFKFVDEQKAILKNQEPEKSFIVSSSTLVPKKFYKDYEKQIERTAKYIRIFKPKLKNIRVVKTAQEDSFLCRLEMVYDGYTVDYEYESAGIKNLIDIFVCLDHTSKGGISFIDEMDVNLNEVYLENLCKYFMEYGRGQLCITVHNTSPMNYLKKAKHSIDFINNDQEIVSWIKNGSKSPVADYKDGYISGIPFNTNDFDFLEVFEG